MALVRAARDGDFTKVVEILKEHPEYIDATDIYGETALIESIYHGNDEISIYLLKHGASPFLCRGDGNSPLHIAANKGRYHVALELLKSETVRNNINKKDSLGNTALHAACKKTQVDLVKLLVDHGANVNYTNKRGQRPINYTRDVRLYRILRGKKWYDDLDGDAIIDRLKKGEQRQVQSPNSPLNSPNKNKKKRRRRGGKNRNKNKTQNNMDNNGNNQEEEIKEEVVIKVGNKEKKKYKKKYMKGKGNNNVNNKDLESDLETWLQFGINDTVSIETQQKYQMIYLDKKLKMKWISYMRSIRKQNLKITDYNRKMCQFADGLYLEYSQPQYDCNHYTPQQLDEYDDDSDY